MEEAAKHFSLYWLIPGFLWKVCHSCVCVCVCCQWKSRREQLSIWQLVFLKWISPGRRTQKRLLGHLLGEDFQQLPSCPLQSPPLITQALKWPHWCCWPSGNSQHTSAFPGYAQLWNTLDNSRCQWPYPWLRWWHCCHLLSTLWGIYSSSPALLHKIWESLWSLDCPDSNRWTPEEDAPSSDQVIRGAFHSRNNVFWVSHAAEARLPQNVHLCAFLEVRRAHLPGTINGHTALHM